MTDDKGRPDDGDISGGDNRDSGDAGAFGQGPREPGQFGHPGYGQGYGQAPGGQDQYGQGYGQTPGGQGQYGQGYGQDQYGQTAGGQGYQAYPGNQGYQGYQGQQQYGGYPGQGQGPGQWGQQAFGDPGAGVAQPGGELPPTSPVMSGPAKFDITRPLTIGFKRVNANVGSWLGFAAAAIGVIVLVMVILFGVVFGGMFASLSDFDPATGTSPNAGGLVAAFTALALMYPILFAIMFLMMVFSYRGAFEEVDGRQPAFGTFFRITRWGSLIGVWILSGLVALAAMIPGYAVLFLGAGMATRSEGAGMALVFLGYFVVIAGVLFVAPITTLMPLLVMDGRARPTEAPAVAWGLVKGRFWPVLGAMLLASLVGSAGTFLCYIGAIYTMPISMVAYVDIYRQLVGGRRPVPMP